MRIVDTRGPMMGPVLCDIAVKHSVLTSRVRPWLHGFSSRGMNHVHLHQVRDAPSTFLKIRPRFLRVICRRYESTGATCSRRSATLVEILDRSASFHSSPHTLYFVPSHAENMDANLGP